MGWHKAGRLWCDENDGFQYGVRPLLCKKCGFTLGWNPIYNLNHTREVEMKLKEMGLQDKYEECLVAVVPYKNIFDLVTASAPNRMEAVWRTINGG